MSSNKKIIGVIEPSKCAIEDYEILAFETEEQLSFYTLWHDALVANRRGIPENHKPTPTPVRSSHRTLPSSASRPAIVPAETRARQPAVQTPGLSPLATQTAANRQDQGSASLPNGLTVLNSTINTLPNGKQLMKYKLTKLYNKLRGRQQRRNFVIEKQRNAKIEAEISKSYINSWLAYTALQALRLPENHMQQLNTTTANSKILTPMGQQQAISSIASAASVAAAAAASSPSKKVKLSSPNKKSNQTTTPVPSQPKPTPMHLVYIDPGTIITYSNRINPQQVAEYRRKSHLLPSSATSKKSSAASYDVYEIMEVLANTNKTNVTITRNANRPSQGGNSNTGSIYSHSVNANTPGIVSTQLHLQARSYLDSMRQFYAEEAKRLEELGKELEREPSIEEQMSKYLNLIPNI